MAEDILKPEKGGNPKAAQTRIKSLSAAAIGGQRAHDLRIGPQPSYVEASRSHLNRVLLESLTGTKLRAICQERRAVRQTVRAMKSNASVGVAGIITFGHKAQRIFERLTPKQQDAAYWETAEAIAARLNTTLTGLVVHVDETAPHAHFQLPAYDLNGNPISDVAKRGVLRDLQTITAEVMGRHAPGIERGRSKYDRLKAGAAPAEVVNRSVAQLRDEAIPELEAKVEAKETALAEVQEKLATNLDRLAKARVAAEGEGQKAEKARKRAETYEARAIKAQAEVDRLADEIAAARDSLDRIEAAKVKAESDLAQSRAKAAVLAAELAEQQEQQAARERELEYQARSLEKAAAHLEAAVTHAVEGRYDAEITAADMRERAPRAEEELAVLRDAAPDGRATWGWRARFWSLNFTDGTPKPLLPPIRGAITSAFDRLATWAEKLMGVEVAAEKRAAAARKQAEVLESRLAPLQAAVAALDDHEAREVERHDELRRRLLREKGEEMFRRLTAWPDGGMPTPRDTQSPVLAVWCALHPEESSHLRKALGLSANDTLLTIFEKVREGYDRHWQTIASVDKSDWTYWHAQSALDHARFQLDRGASWADMLRAVNDDSRQVVGRVTKLLVDAVMQRGWKPEPPPADAAPALPLDERTREAVRRIDRSREPDGPS
ncbi:MAG: plasmid recombination protein [Paracoccus sp. (in: a-proteobacteria)]|uniref:plasmid recombination protein n=1 Tax=Paracoccus sp. TaxID=267 RepID=UPI0026E10835|nr:plasmid recombination protein [Paracoccus sp. (in: a-proteobacteria)]MDO5631628.1 plasmid recombination protein [Paracoccus sp. (in: a-proteobacteria)]